MFKHKTKLQDVYSFVAHTEHKFSTNILEKCEKTHVNRASISTVLQNCSKVSRVKICSAFLKLKNYQQSHSVLFIAGCLALM